MTLIDANINLFINYYRSERFYRLKKILQLFYNFFHVHKKFRDLFVSTLFIIIINNVIPLSDYLDWLKNNVLSRRFIFPRSSCFGQKDSQHIYLFMLGHCSAIHNHMFKQPIRWCIQNCIVFYEPTNCTLSVLCWQFARKIECLNNNNNAKEKTSWSKGHSTFTLQYSLSMSRQNTHLHC